VSSHRKSNYDIKYITLIAFLFLLGMPQQTSADTVVTPKIVTPVEATLSSSTPDSLRSFAIEVADQEGVSTSTMVYVLQHESNFDPNAIGDHGAAHNVAQFHKPTFEWMKAMAIKQGLPYENLSYNSAKDQIILLGWALKNNYGCQWTTYKRYVYLRFTSPDIA
jgi:hypothetical protein